MDLVKDLSIPGIFNKNHDRPIPGKFDEDSADRYRKWVDGSPLSLLGGAMRYLTGLCLTVLWLGVDSSPLVFADTAPALVWDAAFSAISPSKADSQLVVLVITNDDPFATEQPTETEEAQPSDSAPRVWCAEVLASDTEKVLRERPDLQEKLNLQALAVGLPKELSGGVPNNQPSRAVVLVCDGYYRLLGITVGVPDSNELTTLIEDAEDVQRSIALDDELQRNRLIQFLVERNRTRLSRMWRNVLDDVYQSFDGETKKESRAGNVDSIEGNIFRLAERLQPAYEVDSSLRFGLKDQTDRRRLAILEQHPEARDAWCQTMTPFVAGVNVTDHWRELVECVWGLPPIAADVDVTDVQRWTQQQLSADLVVLVVAPPRLLEGSWPPSGDDKIARAWSEVHKLATARSARTITLEQLASLIRALELRPIDAYRPSLARYVMLEDIDSNLMVVRGSDPPGRFATLLKRSQSDTTDSQTPPSR